MMGPNAQYCDPVELAEAEAQLAATRAEVAERARKRKEAKAEKKAREAAERQRYEEDKPDNEKEAAHFARLREQCRQEIEQMGLERERELEIQHGHVAGLDLVAMALQDPSQLNRYQKFALLGQTPHWPDQRAFLAKLDGYSPKDDEYRTIRAIAASTHRPLQSPTLCKFALCDGRIPDDFRAENKNDSIDANAFVEERYQEQKRLEETQDPLEQARAAVRTDEELRGRLFATRMLHAFEAAEREGREADPEAIWKEIGPRDFPQWVEDVFKSGQSYGFTFYSSKEVAEDRPVSLQRWRNICEGYRDVVNKYADGYVDGFPEMTRQVGALVKMMHLDWVTDFHPSEKNRGDIRSHFRSQRPRNETSQILCNAFVVVDSACVFPELDTCDVIITHLHYEHPVLVWPPPPHPQGNMITARDFPKFFVWVYDAEWELPSMGTLPLGHTAQESSDEDGYQGRLKVDVRVLFTWFYHAMVQGSDLKALWRRAQTLQDQVWTAEVNKVTWEGPRQLV